MKKYYTIRFSHISLMVSVLLIISCQKTPQDNSPIIARVGRSILTMQDLNRSIPPEYSDQITHKQRLNYVKQWIDTELLYQEAVRRNIHKEEEIIKRLDQMKKDLLSAEMINRNSSGMQKQRIPEETIKDYYEKHKESFIREHDVVKYIEIIVEDLVTGWKVRNLVTATNFLELAKEYSTIPVQDPNTASFVPLKNLPPEIANVVFNIRINGTTSPIKLSDGVHIIRVLDKQKAGEICLLEEVREEIISTLSAQSQKKDIENLLAALRQKSDYVFNFELLTQDRKDSKSTDKKPSTESIKKEKVTQ